MSDLARQLSDGLAPVSPSFVSRRLLVGLGAGALVSIAFVLAVLGVRPDLVPAMGTGMFWAKLAYPFALALIAGLAAERLGRPAASARGRLVWLAVPFLAVAALGAVQFLAAAPHLRQTLVMGESARVCPFLVLASSLAPFAGLVWAMRGLAPTRLGETGAVIGLAAGGAGAFAYAWHCTESGGAFLALWYTAGILAAAALGALLGPYLLRWK
ncbi:MAG TPA: DUF1109 domain-containing protein [Rhizomicrobium sp.]|nr:DUF1109 domain-containing protein [Rhizomicrobium sp.]